MYYVSLWEHTLGSRCSICEITAPSCKSVPKANQPLAFQLQFGVLGLGSSTMEPISELKNQDFHDRPSFSGTAMPGHGHNLSGHLFSETEDEVHCRCSQHDSTALATGLS